MEITANGKKENLTADSLSVSDLLTELKVKQAQYVTVELNGQILDRENFGNTAVNNGDTVEFLYFMGGGR